MNVLSDFIRANTEGAQTMDNSVEYIMCQVEF